MPRIIASETASGTPTRWVVFTGAPCSGKSTMIDALALNGFPAVPEVARQLIAHGLANGQTITQIRGNVPHFQHRVNQLKLEIESQLDPQSLIFFDRGLPDSMTYYQLAGLDPRKLLDDCRVRRYAHVFCLEPVGLDGLSDGVRIENPGQIRRLDELSMQVYRDLGYEPIRVPVFDADDRQLSVAMRTAFVFKHILNLIS